MSHTMVRVPGGELFVEDSPERDLPVVLALHSLFLDGRMFDGFADATAGHVRVVRPDFRAQGRSSGTDARVVTMEQCAEDVEALVEAMDLGPVHLVLSSMGGDVGLRFAAARGDLVRSMVIIGSSARAEPAEQRERFLGLVDAFEAHGFTGELLEMIVQVMFGQTTRSDPARAELVDRYRSEFAALPAGVAPALRGVVERTGVVDLLPRIAAPALVITGEEDMPRPTAWSDELCEHLPDAELWRLPGVGHSPLLEAPEIVHPRVLAFVESAERRANTAAATGR